MQPDSWFWRHEQELLAQLLEVTVAVNSEKGSRFQYPRPFTTRAQDPEQLASVTEIHSFFKG